MINLAGVEKCDIVISKELNASGINYEYFSFKFDGEVPSKIYAYFHGWVFKRAWNYWIATTETTPLLFKYANELYYSHGDTVRVSGDCGCPSPKDAYKEVWDIGVNCYHIDTQQGLNVFVEMVEKQTNEFKYE